MENLRLEPMDQEYYDYLMALLEVEYSAEQVASGSWNEKDAAEAYREQTSRFLPEGLQSPGSHLMLAYDGPLRVGHVWLGPTPQGPDGDMWIFHILVDESLRGRGYGRRLLVSTEDYARSLGALRLGLNVFGTNAVARALYDSSGYEVTAQRMLKDL